jgi:hypothetical protein
VPLDAANNFRRAVASVTRSLMKLELGRFCYPFGLLSRPNTNLFLRYDSLGFVMRTMLQALLMGAACAIGFTALGRTQSQSDFPTRPIKLVVPFPAGGGIDVSAGLFRATTRYWAHSSGDPN